MAITNIEVYTTGKITTLLSEKVTKANMPIGKSVTDTVTFQDLIDMGFITANQ